MTDYGCECIFYLGLEILKCLMLEQNFMYIDEYYNAVKRIYEDYKEHDNKNKSLLDSIHEYIDNNEQKILHEIKGAIEF